MEGGRLRKEREKCCPEDEGRHFEEEESVNRPDVTEKLGKNSRLLDVASKRTLVIFRRAVPVEGNLDGNQILNQGTLGNERRETTDVEYCFRRFDWAWEKDGSKRVTCSEPRGGMSVFICPRERSSIEDLIKERGGD